MAVKAKIEDWVCTIKIEPRDIVSLDGWLYIVLSTTKEKLVMLGGPQISKNLDEVMETLDKAVPMTFVRGQGQYHILRRGNVQYRYKEQLAW